MSDPSIRPMATYFVKVGIMTGQGEEMRQFKVRAPPDLQHTAELEGLAVAFVRKLGFVTTGKAQHL